MIAEGVYNRVDGVAADEARDRRKLNDPSGYPRPDKAQEERAQKQNTPPTFKIWTAEEIWKPLEPPEYLMDGLFVRGSLALIVAYGGSLKTWMLEDGWISVGTGSPWLGRFKTRKTGALIIDFESGDYELRRRAHRLARGRKIQIPIEGCAFVTMPNLSLADDAFFVALRPLAETCGFIGVDSLAAGSGGIDENDARFATSLNRLKAIAAETGCVIVVLHHTKKGNGEDKDQREMVRGSSAIFNACDVVLQMTRRRDGAFLVQQTKARGGKAVESFVVRVDDPCTDATVVLAKDADAEAEDVAEKADDFAAVKAKVLSLLAHDHDCRSKNEIYRRVKGNKKRALEAIDELDERGLIAKVDRVYRLASEVET